MKKIYITLTHTGTILSKIIRCYTKDEFSHVSISLDRELNQMYSFGRLRPYNPFFAGFVHERRNHGTFKRFKETETCIYSLEVKDKEYDIIARIINEMNKDSKKYKFNLVGLFAVCIHVKIRSKNSFYCAEFVKYLLEKSKVECNLPEIIKPEDFKKIGNIKKEYKGKLRNYTTNNILNMNNRSEDVAV